MSVSVSVPATTRSSDAVIAYTILRVSFGANIMLHGVSRIVMGHAAFLAYLTHYFEKASYIPVSMLSAFATVQPWVELILGLLLMIGLATASLDRTRIVLARIGCRSWSLLGIKICRLQWWRRQLTSLLRSFFLAAL